MRAMCAASRVADRWRRAGHRVPGGATARGRTAPLPLGGGAATRGSRPYSGHPGAPTRTAARRENTDDDRTPHENPRPDRRPDHRPWIALATASAPALAGDGFLVRLAFESGGDRLGRVEFEGGDSESIKAGGEVHVEAGLRRGFAGPAWETDLSVGYKSDSANASNGDFAFTRVTLNAMQYYLVNDRVRVGAGLTYHLGPELDVDVPSGVGRVTRSDEADDALGFMVGVDYVVTNRVELGARATRIDYEFADVGRKLSGESVGAYLTYRFGVE